MTTGQRIKILRKAANLSQDELARITGYTDRSSIAKIESDKCELTESKIKLFAKVLNTTPAALIGLTSDLEQETYSNTEKNLVASWRRADDRVKGYVASILQEFGFDYVKPQKEEKKKEAI